VVKRNFLTSLDQERYRIVRVIGRQAQKLGLKAYLVGGIVRDLILKRPNLDLDIAVEGDNFALVARMAKLLKARPVIHQVYKTATLYDKKGRRIDFAGARWETYARPGALPTVRAGSLKDDLLRRDFTVNALALSIHPDSFGALIDVCGGLEDLSKGRIRVFHDKSFIDDPTRILRAVRFEERLAFRLEAKTKKLLQEALNKRAYLTVTAPRYFVEFKKILMEDDPCAPLQRLLRLNAVQIAGVTIRPRWERLKVLYNRMKQLKTYSFYRNYERWWLLYLMAVLEDVQTGSLKRLLKEIQIKKEYEKAILVSQEAARIKKTLSKKILTNSQIYKILKKYPSDTILYVHACASHDRVHQRIERYLKDLCRMSLRISGHDLKRLGVPSGQRIGFVLKEVLYRKMDSNLRTKSQELKAAKEFVLR